MSLRSERAAFPQRLAEKKMLVFGNQKGIKRFLINFKLRHSNNGNIVVSLHPAPERRPSSVSSVERGAQNAGN